MLGLRRLEMILPDPAVAGYPPNGGEAETLPLTDHDDAPRL